MTRAPIASGAHACELVLDTSACVAVLQREPTAERLVAALASAEMCYISSATVVELGLVMMARFGDVAERDADLLVHRLSASIVPVAAEHVELARSAFRRFGKGRHPAGLNFGDCFAYALAASLELPLLFTGADFGNTDLAVAPY